MEIFKDIKYCENIYQVSNLGYVLSLNYRQTKKQFRLTGAVNNCGYNTVRLKINGKLKSFLVHRLVAEMFIPNPQNKPQVNHINSIRTDNRVENLEWTTPSENIRHSFDSKLRIANHGNKHPLSKLNDSDVLEIRKSNLKHSVLAKKYNVTHANIRSVAIGLTWRHLL